MIYCIFSCQTYIAFIRSRAAQSEFCFLLVSSLILLIVKLPPQAKPESWLRFPMVTRKRRTRRTTPPKFSQKGLCQVFENLHAALSYQKNKIAPLNKCWYPLTWGPYNYKYIILDKSVFLNKCKSIVCSWLRI